MSRSTTTHTRMTRAPGARGHGTAHLAACPLQGLGQIGRQLGGEAHLCSGDRMAKAEAGSVQELAPESVPLGVAVARVPRDRVADGREVGADLVRAAGLEADVDEGVLRKQLDDLEMSTRLPRPPASHRHSLARPVIAATRGVDRPAPRADPPLDQGDVAPAHLALAHLAR